MYNRRNLWILVIPALLLATGLAAQRLADYPFDNDERYSMRIAGGMDYGPYSLGEVWSSVARIYPDQAYGLPLLYSVWGRVFGWSEFSVRVLPLFAGILTMAWTYRAGRDWFAPLVGLVATALLASSVFFISYLHIARSYTMVALFAMVTVWGYWRLALRSPGDSASLAGQ